MTLEKSFSDKDVQTLKNKKQYKQAFRTGMPDKARREVLLQLFNLNPMTCESRYQTIVKMAGDEFLVHAKKNQIASKGLHYSYLNLQG